MAIIKPYSAFTHDDTNVDNFPGLVHAWVCNDVEQGQLEWVDRINLHTVTHTTGFTKNPDGTVTGSPGVSVVDAPNINPGAKDILIIAVGYFDGGRSIQFGEANNKAGYSVHTIAATSYAVADDAGLNWTGIAGIGSAIGASGAVGSFGMTLEHDGDSATAGPDTLGLGRSFSMSNAGVLTYNAGVANTGGVGLGNGFTDALDNTWVFPLGNATAADVGGVYVLHLENGLPSERELLIANQWMIANPNKGLCPNLIGLS